MKAAWLALALVAGPALAVRVPFVGCPSDGQLGPRSTPRAGRAPDVPAYAAPKLAYYAAADGPAVLGPRGWHCFGSYGSNGASRYVTPAPITHTGRLAGPAIQLTLASGGTSGRFEVAEVAARLFPAARDFVDRVAAEGILDHDLARGPYPADRITHRGPYRALFTTPAHAVGLGTEASFLVRGPLPIDGIAILQPDGDHDLTFLSARLPSTLRPLVAVILEELGARRRAPAGR